MVFAPSYIIQTDIFKTVFQIPIKVVISYDFIIIIILIIMILIIFITMMIAQHYCSLCNFCIDGSVLFHDSFSLNLFSGCLAP